MDFRTEPVDKVDQFIMMDNEMLTQMRRAIAAFSLTAQLENDQHTDSVVQC